MSMLTEQTGKKGSYTVMQQYRHTHPYVKMTLETNSKLEPVIGTTPTFQTQHIWQ